MDFFKQKIKDCILSKWLEFPWIDKDIIIDKMLSGAEEYVLINIASDILKKEDKELFRDAYLSAPDIFDADEFLSERIGNYDKYVDRYFDYWLEKFKKNL